ncbi:putative ATP-binding/permease fusion ABC transporter [Pseudomonas paraeruginosa]|nr:ABC transporter transmembrane domain-containing protein [Pseudomonas aeruginosa]UYT21757.1 putative ATP-binding/permease fusion ABC transporter [Pseudomonas aeruginosa]
MPAILSSRQRNALRLAWRFMAPYRWRMLGALAALLFTAAITLSLGQGIRLLVDQGFLTASPERLDRYILLFFLLVLGLALGTFVRFYLVSWIGERFVADIRKRVFDHLIELHPGFYETNRSSEIQSRLTADTTLLQTVIGSSLSMALRNALMLVGGVLLMFVTNAKLTSIVVLALPLVIAPILLFGRRVRSLSRESQDRVADVGSYVGETLGQIKTVQAYNHQAQDRQRFAGTVERAFDTARRRIAQRAWLVTVVIVLVLGAVGVMLWVGGRDVIAGSISAGELAAFVFYSLVVGMAFGTLSEVIGELQRAAGAAERIAELLGARSQIRPPAQPLVLPARVSGRLELQGVSFAYPTRPAQWAIDDISLVVEPGETLALVGPSGAGKSTLFDLLLRFFDPQQGRLLLDGQPIVELDPADLRRCFALVSQNPALFFGSVEDNIRYGRPGASAAEVEAAARAAHAHEFILRLPQGYATHLGEGGIGLSGGAAPAPGDRPRAAGGRAAAAARRSHQRAGCGKRTPDPASPAQPDERAYHPGDRPPPGHGTECRSHRGDRPGPVGGDRQPCPADRREPAVCALGGVAVRRRRSLVQSGLSMPAYCLSSSPMRCA